MTSFLSGIPVARVWVLLALVAVLAFAACATGAMSCAIGRPLGLSAALGAALVSLFDAPSTSVEAPIEEHAEV